MTNFGNTIRIAVLVLFCLTLQANAQDLVGEERFHPASSLELADFADNDDLVAAFDKWLFAVKAGDKLDAFNESNRILEVMGQLGTRNLFDVADLCIAVGMAELEKGAYNSAILAGEDAIKFAPDHSAPYFFLARALFASDNSNISGVVTNVTAGLKAMLSDKVARDVVVSYVVRFIFLSALLAFLFTFLALFSLHYHALLADIASFFPVRPEGCIKVALGALVIIVPLAVGGWLLFLLALPLFLWPYLRVGGRGIVAVFALFVLFTPYVFDYVSKGIALTNGDTYRALYMLSNNTWDYETKKILERESKKNPDNRTLTFAIGYLNKLRGDKNAAISAYDILLKKEPNNTKAMINKGNVYFVAKEYNKAIGMYQKAVKTNPQLVEAHFNLSNTYVSMFKTKESESEYRLAIAIDKDKTAFFLEQTSENPDTKVIDFPITDKDIMEFEGQFEKDTEKVFKALWFMYIGDLTPKIYQMISIGFLLLIGVLSVFWKSRISHRTCSSCGLAFHPPIYLDSDHPKCNQCVAAQSVKGAVSTAKKDKKLKEVREYKNRRSAIATILDRFYPGVGRTYFQSHLSGFAFSFIASFVVVYAASTIGVELVMQGAEVQEVARSHMFFLGFAACYWFVMNTLFKKDFY